MKEGISMYIKKKFLAGITALLLSSFTYAEILTGDINGNSVDYYVPDIAKAKVPDNMQMGLKILIEDPTPLPDNYLPPKMNSILMLDPINKVTATTFTIDYIAAGDTDVYGETCYTFPEEAKDNFEAAATIWAGNIDTDVPITIEACWANFSGSTLGYSGSVSAANFTNAPIADTDYKLSLANSLAA